MCLGLKERGVEKIQTPNSSGHYLLTGNKCPPYVVQNDFKQGETTNPEYFFLVTGDEKAKI